MSSHAFKKPLIQVCFIFLHVGSYISQLFASSLTFPTYYAIIFLLYEVVLKALREVQDIFILLRLMLGATSLLYHTSRNLSTALFKKFPFFHKFCGIPSHALAGKSDA